jgi:hypothetical protein
MAQLLQSLSTSIGNFWCQTMHSDAMWPVKGEYQCRTCFRRYPVIWEAQDEQAVKAPAQRVATVRARMVS